MSKNMLLLKNTAILAAGRLSNRLVAMLMLPIYTIFLGPEEFGLVDLVVSYVALLTPLLTLQLDKASFRFLVDARDDEKRAKVIISSTLAILITTSLIASAIYLVVVSLFHFSLAIALLLVMWSSVICGLLMQFTRGFGKNGKYAIGNMILALLTLILTGAAVALLHMGVEGVLWSMLFSNAVASIYFLFTLRLWRYVSISPRGVSRHMQKELFSYAWPLVPSAMSWWFIRTFDRTLIVLIMGIAANGVYAAANKYAIILNALYAIFDLSWNEAASQHIDSKDRDKFFSDVFNATYRFFGSVALIMIAVTPFVFGILVGEAFQEAYLYIPILVIGVMFNAAFSQYNAIYAAKKKTKSVLVVSVMAAVISVGLNMLLIPKIGLFGASFSLVISYLVLVLWRHHTTKKYVSIHLENSILIKLLAAFALVVTMYYIGHPVLNLVSLLLVVGIGYALNRNSIKRVMQVLLQKYRARNKSAG